MIVYTIQDSTGRVEDTFVGNGDELTHDVYVALQFRVNKLGYLLRSHTSAPVSELQGIVDFLEKEAETE